MDLKMENLLLQPIILEKQLILFDVSQIKILIKAHFNIHFVFMALNKIYKIKNPLFEISNY